ncbi:hypothetical protein BKA70DRAFT_1105039 [Coprinopsis sp. MPI-PUGE-AT-0042]|nr:hypothetical protein BKA70DRAFT_1105039 [Coprinopsis sp. MPI-PUGE-AT-0042]
MSEFDPSASSSSLASQVTLIDEAPLILKFNRRSASNATLYSGSFPIYKVTTNKDGTKTDVYDVVGQEAHIATIKRREFLPDVIKYRNRPAGSDIVKLASWLKYERLEEGMTCVSFDTSCGQFTWRYGHAERYRMALYKSKDFSSPIAYLKNTDRNIPMLLHINAGHQEMIEDILLSVLILEYKLKMYERLKKHDLLYGPLLGSLISLK